MHESEKQRPIHRKRRAAFCLLLDVISTNIKNKQQQNKTPTKKKGNKEKPTNLTNAHNSPSLSASGTGRIVRNN